jgi:hypothetical protein
VGEEYRSWSSPLWNFLHSPVTTAWRVLSLRMEERPPIWRVVTNILNKPSRISDKGWSSSLVVGRGANNSWPWKRIFVKKYSRTKPPIYQP